MNTNSRTRKIRLPVILSWLSMAVIMALFGVFAVKAGMFAFLVSRQDTTKIREPLPDQVSSGFSTITGFDKDRQPYKLSANSVLQDIADNNIAHLKMIVGVVSRNDGAQLNLRADKAQYHADKNVLEMRGNVKFDSLNRFTAYLEKATVTLKEKRLYANVPVTVVFDRGSIRAGGIEVSENGKKISFFGGVETQFDGEGSVAQGNKTGKQKEK